MRGNIHETARVGDMLSRLPFFDNDSWLFSQNIDVTLW